MLTSYRLVRASAAQMKFRDCKKTPKIPARAPCQNCCRDSLVYTERRLFYQHLPFTRGAIYLARLRYTALRMRVLIVRSVDRSVLDRLWSTFEPRCTPSGVTRGLCEDTRRRNYLFACLKRDACALITYRLETAAAAAVYI